jgi:predicted transposase/invertase (TIGR01784 family)
MSEEQKSDLEPVVPEGSGSNTGPGGLEEISIKKYLTHDGLFRVAFENPALVESFTRENLPAAITENLDFSTMEQDKDTFIDQHLTRCYADVLYYTRFKDNPAYLYFLYEHKSSEPDFPGLQLLKNMTFIWDKHLVKYKETKKLPPIIPMVVYHGEYAWKAGTSFISMFDIPVILEKYIPAFKYELYDISHMPEEQIKGEIKLRIILMALRYIFQPEIMTRLKSIFQLFLELKDKTDFNRYLELLLIYLGSNLKNVKAGQLRDAVDEVLEEGGAIVNTIFQQIREEGKEIGVKEGIEIGEEKGMERGEEKSKLRIALNCLMKGMDIKIIAQLTELPVERIESLKTTLRPVNNSQS